MNSGLHPDAVRAAADAVEALQDEGMYVFNVQVAEDAAAPNLFEISAEAETELESTTEFGIKKVNWETDHADTLEPLVSDSPSLENAEHGPSVLIERYYSHISVTEERGD